MQLRPARRCGCDIGLGGNLFVLIEHLLHKRARDAEFDAGASSRCVVCSSGVVGHGDHTSTMRLALRADMAQARLSTIRRTIGSKQPSR